MQKNEVFEGLVEGLGTNGEGIIKCGGTTAFVPFCLVGERVRFKVVKADKNCVYGKLENVLNAAYSRVNPPCPVFFKCGGCDLQHMNYAAQLQFKRELVARSLFKTGGIDFNVSETVPCESEYRYRNKLALPIGVDERGETALGFYGARSHRIIPIEDCLIQSEWVKKVINAVLEYSKTRHIAGYNEFTRTGVLRRIVVRELNGRFLVVLVTAEREIKGIDFLLSLLDRIFRDYGFFLNFNDKRTNVIFGEEFRLLKGSPVYECGEAGITFEAGAETFVQINGDVRAKLYERAVALADGEDVVVDCYAGGGLLTAMFAKKCRRAYGIEVVAESSACADRLKEANGLSDKMTNIVGRVEDELQGVLKKEKNAVLVLDPPRAGIARSVLNAILQSGAEKVILISCNPATLARDLGLLTGTLQENAEGALTPAEHPEGKYEIVSVQPFDMFPQTKHVETLVMLSKKNRGE